jgi:hypothetical protein
MGRRALVAMTAGPRALVAMTGPRAQVHWATSTLPVVRLAISSTWQFESIIILYPLYNL